MSLAAAHAGARARQGGLGAARTFDGAHIDLTTGPRIPLETFTTTYTGNYLSAGSGAPSNGGNVGAGIAGQRIAYDGTTPYAVELYADATMVDCYSELPVAGEDSGPVAVVNCRVPTAVNAQVAFQNSQPAIHVSGPILHCTVNNTAEDGLWPMGGPVGRWQVIEDLYAMGGSVPFYAGYTVSPSVIPWTSGDVPGTNTGLPLTKAQILSVVNYYNQNGSGSNGGTNGVTVPWGAFILCPSAGLVISPIYQCIGSVDGTTNPPLIGNESTFTWPSAGGSGQWRNQTTGSSLPFASGNALLAPIGGCYHCDAFQCVGSIARVAIRNFKIGQFANTMCLLQNDDAIKALPPMNWLFEHGQIYGAGAVDIPINTLTGSASYTTPTGSNMHNPTGPFSRNSDGTWQVDPASGQSVPWFVTWRDLQHNNSISSDPASRNPATNVTFEKAYDPSGAPVLPNIDARKLLLANQYGWDSGDQRPEMMENGTYDWIALGQPAPVSSVLEARFQALSAEISPSSTASQALSPAPGVVGAQAMPVLYPSCRNQVGLSLTPSTSSGITYPSGRAGVTDSRGYNAFAA
jgi:hypothetical protein